MIQVAICITNLDVGGAETVLLDLLRLRPDDIEVKVYSLISGGALVGEIEALGVPVVGLGMRRGIPSIPGLLRLMREWRRRPPDVVHTWLYHADLVGGLAARLAGIRNVVWHLHNTDLTPGRVRLMTRLVVRACALLSRSIPARVVCCAEVVRTVHIARGYPAGKMIVEPNGVDVERFRPSTGDRLAVRAELDVPADVPLIGMVARDDPQKGHAVLFDAIRLIQESGRAVRFVLVGRGIDSSNLALAELQRSLAEPATVSMLGERRDVPRLLAALDIVTSSSLGEALPVSLLEAMACGVPCVFTDVGDSRVVLSDTGFVVAPGDPGSLAAGWARMLDLDGTERLRYGARARERVIANYTIGRLAERCWSLYRELASDRHGVLGRRSLR